MYEAHLGELNELAKWICHINLSELISLITLQLLVTRKGPKPQVPH